jgi:cytochrome oxidase assembly protein ShyY1
MYRFLLRPRWLAFTVLCILAVVAMVQLGSWQLHRLDERREFNAEVRSNLARPVEPLDAVLTADAERTALEWRRVRLRGTYLADETVLVVNRSQGGRPGRNAVTPLRLDDGRLVLVNRGFVVSSDEVPDPPAGEVEVTGLLRDSEVRHRGQPEDAAGVDLIEIRRIDIDKLAPQLPGETVGMYIERSTSEPAEAATVQTVVLPELDEGPHLSYSVQWFAFSACVVVGWALAVRRSAQPSTGRRRGPPPILESER